MYIRTKAMCEDVNNLLTFLVHPSRDLKVQLSSLICWIGADVCSVAKFNCLGITRKRRGVHLEKSDVTPFISGN
jgi:hypothetical protein